MDRFDGKRAPDFKWGEKLKISLSYGNLMIKFDEYKSFEGFWY